MASPESGRFFTWVSSIFRGGFSAIRRRNAGILKVIIIGDQKVGKSALLRCFAQKELMPLKTWDPKQQPRIVTITHKEDRAQTYIEEMDGKPYPEMALSTSDMVVIVFSLVDKLTWRSVMNDYLAPTLADDRKRGTARAIMLVGLKADLRDEAVKKLKEEQKEKGRHHHHRHGNSNSNSGNNQSGNGASEEKKEPYWTPSEHERWNASNLPIDVLMRIFSYLHTKDVINCSYVCLQWSIIAKHPSTWASRARGIVLTNEVRDRLKAPEYKPYNIPYFELNATDLNNQRPIQQLLYSIVATAAAWTRELPPKVVQQIAAERANEKAAAEKAAAEKANEKAAEKAAASADKTSTPSSSSSSSTPTTSSSPTPSSPNSKPKQQNSIEDDSISD